MSDTSKKGSLTSAKPPPRPHPTSPDCQSTKKPHPGNTGTGRRNQHPHPPAYAPPPNLSGYPKPTPPDGPTPSTKAGRSGSGPEHGPPPRPSPCRPPDSRGSPSGRTCARTVCGSCGFRTGAWAGCGRTGIGWCNHKNAYSHDSTMPGMKKGGPHTEPPLKGRRRPKPPEPPHPHAQSPTSHHWRRTSPSCPEGNQRTWPYPPNPTGRHHRP